MSTSRTRSGKTQGRTSGASTHSGAVKPSTQTQQAASKAGANTISAGPTTSVKYSFGFKFTRLSNQVFDFMEVSNSSTTSSHLKFDIPLAVDLVTRLYLHVTTPALSASLGVAKNNYRVSNSTTGMAGQTMATYASYVKGTDCLCPGMVAPDYITKNKYRQGRSAFQKQTGTGYTPQLDIDKLNAITSAIYANAGGILVEAPHPSPLSDCGLQMIQGTTLSEPSPDYKVPAMYVQQGMTFLGAQRALLSCYAAAPEVTVSFLPDDAYRNLPAIPKGSMPLPAPLTQLSCGAEPTEEEKVLVAQYVWGFWFAKLNGGRVLDADLGLLPPPLSDAADGTYPESHGCGSSWPDVNFDALIAQTPLTNSACTVRWCDGVGYRAVQYAQLMSSTMEISGVTGDWLFCRAELFGLAGRRQREMVGFFEGDVGAMERFASQIRDIYVPLDFWFTELTSRCLKSYKTSFSNKFVQVKLSPLKDLIVVNDPMVQVSVTAYAGATQSGPIVLTGVDAEYAYFSITMAVMFVLLSSEDRKLLDTMYQGTATTPAPGTPGGPNAGSGAGVGAPGAPAATSASSAVDAEQEVFETLVVNTFDVTENQGPQTYVMNNWYITKFHVWFYRSDVATDAGDYYDFSGLGGEDPITQFEIKLNGVTRFGDQGAAFFRLLVPSILYNQLPTRHIYCFSFALAPTNANYTGSINYPRIATVELKLGMQPEIPAGQVTVFSWVYNMLSMKNNVLQAIYQINSNVSSS